MNIATEPIINTFDSNYSKAIESEKFKLLLQRVLEADTQSKTMLQNGLLSHEARLIIHLAIKDGIMVKEAALGSWLSDRAFYALIKRLENSNIVKYNSSQKDMRIKTLHLDESFKNFLKNFILK